MTRDPHCVANRQIVEELRARLVSVFSAVMEYTAWGWEPEHRAIFGRFVRWFQSQPDTDERFDLLCGSANLNIPLIVHNYVTSGDWADDFGISVMERVWPGERCTGVPGDEERRFDRLLQLLLLEALAYEVTASVDQPSREDVAAKTNRPSST